MHYTAGVLALHFIVYELRLAFSVDTFDCTASWKRLGYILEDYDYSIYLIHNMMSLLNVRIKVIIHSGTHNPGTVQTIAFKL